MADGAVTSAKRRRERWLRWMLRHERQTVAMELAAALHHSRDVRPGKNNGLRVQTTASSGKRPAPPVDVSEPQGGAVTVGYVAAPGPLLEVSSMDGGDSVDGTALRFLIKKAIERQKEWEKEKEEEMQDILRRFRADLPVSDSEWEAWLAWRGIGSSASGKKRKKKKTPRTSSHLTLRRSHRRQRPKMLRIMAGTDQRDSYMAGFALVAPRAVFLPVVFRPKMLVIMAGMDQKERYVAPCRKLRIFSSCSSSQVVDFPVVMQRPIPMVWTVQQTIVIPPVAPVHGGRCPWFAGRADFPVVAQMLDPFSGLFVGPSRFPSCSEQGDRCPYYAGRASSTGRHHPCRGAETDLHGLVDHGDSAVALG